jgi:hypothetical protein
MEDVTIYKNKTFEGIWKILFRPGVGDPGDVQVVRTSEVEEAVVNEPLADLVHHADGRMPGASHLH